MTGVGVTAPIASWTFDIAPTWVAGARARRGERTLDGRQHVLDRDRLLMPHGRSSIRSESARPSRANLDAL